MKTLHRTAAVAALLALPLGMTACGGSKPSKDDVRAGFQKVINEKSGAAASSPEMKPKMTKYTDCILDEAYDDLSPEALNAMKDGDEKAEVPAKDKKTMEKAVNACASTLK